MRGHISTLLNGRHRKARSGAVVEKKEIAKYKQMYEQLNKKARSLYEENESIKKLAKLALDDKLAKKAAKKQLSEEQKRCRRKKQISWNKNVTEYLSIEEYEKENNEYSSDNNDDDEEEEEGEREKYMRKNNRKRKQQRDFSKKLKK